jgi:hypothetical protein
MQNNFNETFVCLFIAARAIVQLLVAVTITRDRASNLDPCLALMAFNTEVSFACAPWGSGLE